MCLALQDSVEPCTLDALLAEHEMGGAVTGVDWLCQHCSEPYVAHNGCTLRGHGAALIFVLKRAVWEQNAWRKCHRRVALPQELMLHSDRYTLRAVAEHIGTMPCSGHYLTWIVEQSSCICYNDSNVTRAESLPARIDQNATLVICVRAAMLPAVSMQGAAQTHPPKEESNTAFAKNRLSCERLSQN